MLLLTPMSPDVTDLKMCNAEFIREDFQICSRPVELTQHIKQCERPWINRKSAKGHPVLFAGVDANP